MSLHTDVGYETGLYRVTRRSQGARVDGHYQHPSDFDRDVSAVDDVANTLTIVGHGRSTGDGPVWIVSDDTLPDGLTSSPYWVIRISDDDLQLAISRDQAIALAAVDITSVGVGTITVSNSFLASADVQPATGAELNDLREGQHSSDIRTIFTDVQLFPRTPTYEPDEIEIDGDVFRVKNVKYHGVISGHYVVTAERVTTP